MQIFLKTYIYINKYNRRTASVGDKMKINIKRLNNDYHMEAVNEEGNVLQLDGAPAIGGHNLGMRPMQLLLTALGGCSAIDVIMILKKQKNKL